MLKLFIYLLFIISVAFASAGVVLSSRLRNRYRHPFFSTLMYFQVFIFTFGFYGIWGQLVIKAFLSSYVSAESIIRFTGISILLGLPFLVFAWLMLLRFSIEITGRKTSNWLVFWFLLLNFLLLMGIGYLISVKSDLKPVAIVRYYFIILSLLYTMISAFLILTPARFKSVFQKKDNLIMAAAITFMTVAEAVVLYFYETDAVPGIIFIFLFFSGNAFLPICLTYQIPIPSLPGESVKNISFEEFCRRYDVSPRESEIIREICNGLSNKEISERLFISLQTVKDHTHRIYIKTNLKSRAQLMNLFREVREND
jgi:DNA-binding CsgD family transcriptional regulator